MSLQQMRHAKLWLAASRGNWALADYEMDELREGFEDASRLHQTYENVPVAALIAKLTPAPLEAIGKAIKGKSVANFARSFDSLTAACNTCHRAANHGFIQIRRPRGSAFSNQKFEPGPK
jgi:cytochrome c553